MRIVVIGASGYLGNAIYKKLKTLNNDESMEPAANQIIRNY